MRPVFVLVAVVLGVACSGGGDEPARTPSTEQEVADDADLSYVAEAMEALAGIGGAQPNVMELTVAGNSVDAYVRFRDSDVYTMPYHWASSGALSQGDDPATGFDGARAFGPGDVDVAALPGLVDKALAQYPDVELRFTEDSSIHIERQRPGAPLVATVEPDDLDESPPDRRYGVKLTFDGGLVECVTGQTELYDLTWGSCPVAG
jgi:hypothetical protein